MASRPMLHALCKKIDEFGGEDWIFDQLASGISVGKIAAQCGVSRRMIYRWRDLREFPDRPTLWAEALRFSGEAHAEMGLDDLTDADGLVPAEIQRAAHISKYRQWLAGKRDPHFADKGIELNFNVGELHLQAVADAKAMMAKPVATPLIEDAEVLAIEAGDPAPAGAVVPSAAEVAVEPQAPAPLPDVLADLM